MGIPKTKQITLKIKPQKRLINQPQKNTRSFDNYLQTILNSTREAIFLLDIAGNIKVHNIYAQRLMSQFTGSDMAVTKNLIAAVPDFRKTDVKKYISEAAVGEIKEYEIMYPNNAWLHVSFFPVYSGKKNILEICCTIKDITLSKKAENELQYEAALLDNVRDAIIATDIDFKITSFNKVAEIIYGLGAKEVVGKKLTDVIQHRFLYGNMEEVLKILQTTGKWSGEKVFTRKSGEEIILEANVSFVFDTSGKKIGFVSVNRDITESVVNRNELNLLSRVIKETSNIVIITDKDGKIIWANDSFTRISEYTLEEALTRKPGQLLSGPEKDPKEIKKIREALHKGEPVEGEILNYSKTGKKFWAHYNIHPVKDEKGNLIKFFSIQSDITELKEIQEEIMQQRLEHQSQVAYATLKGQEDKQTQIGQELHDNINQILAATKLYLGFILNSTGDTGKNVALIKDNIQLAIDEIRNLSHRLVAPRFKGKKLSEALEILAQDLNSNIKVELETGQMKEDNINPDTKLALFRIAQEQIHNINKYSKASQVNLIIKNNDQKVMMEIEDDGVGFELEQKRNGIGISNIYNRAESLYGKAEIISSPGNGCRLNVIIPLKKAV